MCSCWTDRVAFSLKLKGWLGVDEFLTRNPILLRGTAVLGNPTWPSTQTLALTYTGSTRPFHLGMSMR